MQVVGRIDESLSHVNRAHELADGALDDEYLLAGLDAVELYGRTYRLEFARPAIWPMPSASRRQPTARQGGALLWPEEPGCIPRGIASSSGEPG